jgi:diaminopimelate epimerase
MVIEFVKMHGTQNDFVMLHDFSGSIRLNPEQVRFLCDRRAGVGADGVIVVRPSAVADFFMDYLNSDGSLAEMCGNGIRCLAKYVGDRGLGRPGPLKVETRAGIKVVEGFPGTDGTIEKVRVAMGEPILGSEDIPTAITPVREPVVDYPIEVMDRTFACTLVSMGNPHCVIVTEEEMDPLPQRYGPALEVHPLFPAKTNVEFIRIVDRHTIVMRVWERGSGETLSCGTGACASAVAAQLKHLVESPVVVQVRGGDLEIEWKGIQNQVFMTGTSVEVYTGKITL